MTTKPQLFVALSVVASALIALTSQAQTPATTDYQLQILKDCQVLQTRPLTRAETDAYLTMDAQQQQMAKLQAPLDAMEQQLASLQQAMQRSQQGSVNSRIAEQQRIAKTMEAVVASYQPDIDAIEMHSHALEQDAERFQRLIQQDLTGEHYDQLRVLAPGEQAVAGECKKGMFYHVSYDI